MSEPSAYIHKSHNVSALIYHPILIYHLICPTKYRRVLFDAKVDAVLTHICLEIADRYEITFLEIGQKIGTDRDHMHFLVQSIPALSPTQVLRTIKSITAKEMFRHIPSLRQVLWSGAFWSSGYFINTVGRHGNEETIRRYVQAQERESEYQQLYAQQLKLYE